MSLNCLITLMLMLRSVLSMMIEKSTRPNGTTCAKMSTILENSWCIRWNPVRSLFLRYLDLHNIPHVDTTYTVRLVSTISAITMFLRDIDLSLPHIGTYWQWVPLWKGSYESKKQIWNQGNWGFREYVQEKPPKTRISSIYFAWKSEIKRKECCTWTNNEI